MKFGRVVCISLNRRADRRDSFLARVPADWPFGSLEIEQAIDGSVCKPPQWWRQGGGAWGCYRSHAKVIEDALNTGLESILIFEDDATFCEGFSEKAQRFFAALPGDWEQAYLGGQHLTRPLPHSAGVVTPLNVNRTHAYALNSKPAMQKAYRWLNATDQWVNRNHIDHHYGRLHKAGRIKVFAPDRWLCGQAADKSDISWRNVPERWWDGRTPQDSIFVAVIGLHRSGSSCVAMMLHKLGVNMGDRLGGYESKHGGGGGACVDLRARGQVPQYVDSVACIRRASTFWLDSSPDEESQDKRGKVPAPVRFWQRPAKRLRPGSASHPLRPTAGGFSGIPSAAKPALHGMAGGLRRAV